ncbi:hypothetical protein MITS9509_00448 [Synechococcus sp. MIT S9509]|uniref:hypothetical protein n=1 Tax=unclassified Synechococcus TaxID=2626047 RepID=UPI0007BBC4AE|nr:MULTISPECIES: hypothetical protein [unclassified Synechococcus]KZR87647.1 hypothetical protein MITS9504_00069 [Synechococcus sp. MIT S9504]KZR93155.1 hypothetical protein MITS9509_00448 [Synechococcus sp. MIT S9509]
MQSRQPQDNRGWEEKFYSIKDDLIEHAKDYSRYESGFYWYDHQHSGLFFISARMVDKYKLRMVSDDNLELWINDCGLNDHDREECLRKYAYAIYIHHAEAFSITKDGLDFSSGTYTKTPHGECYSLEFVAWFNDVSVELLQEGDEDLKIISWCDG